jgi:hypothetical protein
VGSIKKKREEEGRREEKMKGLGDWRNGKANGQKMKELVSNTKLTYHRLYQFFSWLVTPN